jgi:O-antigen/teichoic acid export membrane protein
LLNSLKKYTYHLKTGAFYTVASLFTTVVNIVAGFLVLRWVGPEEMGVWQMLLIINTYALIGNLGITSGLSRELPFLMGKGKQNEAYSLAETTKAYTLFCAIVTILILIIANIIFYVKGKELIFILSFTTIMLILSINFYRDYILTLFRTNKAFTKLSVSYLIQGALSTALLPVIYFYKFEGYLAYNLSTVAISLLLLFKINPIKVSARFDYKNFKFLFITGMPLFIMAYLYGVSKTFIKFAILHYGGVILLGLFAPVFAIRTGINTLPKIISQYIYPKLSHRYGLTGDSSLLWKPVRNISLTLLLSLSIAVMPIYYFMPEIIETFFPKYLESIFPARMALMSGVVFGSFIGVISLNSVKGYKERLIITLSYISFSVLLPFLFPLFINNKIVALAWAILIIDVLYFMVAYAVTRKKLLSNA